MIDKEGTIRSIEDAIEGILVRGTDVALEEVGLTWPPGSRSSESSLNEAYDQLWSCIEKRLKDLVEEMDDYARRQVD